MSILIGVNDVWHEFGGHNDVDAEKYGLSFVSLQDKLDEAATKEEDTYWLADGVHPTPEGHELIKREWIKAFKNQM